MKKLLLKRKCRNTRNIMVKGKYWNVFKMTKEDWIELRKRLKESLKHEVQYKNKHR